MEGVKFSIVEEELKKAAGNKNGDSTDEPPAKRAMTEAGSSGDFDAECKNILS